MAENRFLQSPIDKLIEESKSYELPKLELPERSEPRSAAQSMRTSGLMPPQDLQGIFEEASAEFGVPLNVLAAVAQQESSYNPLSVNKSSGAKGLFNYMDTTSKALGINPFDVRQSARAAAMQMRERLDKGYTMEEAIMAHHGGDDRRQWGPKTRQYVQDVMGKAGEIGKGFMQSAPQPAADFDPAAIQAELDAQEPGRFKVLSADEAERYQRRADIMSGQGQLQAAQQAVTTPNPITPLTLDNQRRVQQSVGGISMLPVEEQNAIKARERDRDAKQLNWVNNPPVIKPYEPTLWDQIKGLGGPDKDAATVELVMRETAKREGISVEEAYRRAGGSRAIFNPEGRPVIQALAEAAQVLGPQINDVAPAAANTAMRAIRNGDVDMDENWLDKAINATDIEQEGWQDPNYQAFQGVGQSLGFSLVNMAASALAGLAGSTAGPVGGAGAALGTSGTISYRASKDEFLDRVRKNYVNLYGVAPTQEQWEKMQADADSAATKYGAFEAIPEAVSTLIFVRALSRPLAGASRAQRLGDALKRVAQNQGSEQTSETITGVGQNRAELEAGLTKEELSAADVFRKQALNVALTSGIMSSAGMAGRAAYDATPMGKRQRIEGELQEEIERNFANWDGTIPQAGVPTGQEANAQPPEEQRQSATPAAAPADTTPQSAAPATPASEAPRQVPPAAVNDNAAPAAQQAAPQPPKGPLSRAAERVIQQSGEPVTVVAPDGEVAGTLESYVDQGNGRWTARVTAEDGNTYDFTHEDGVNIVRQQQAPQQMPESNVPVEEGDVVRRGRDERYGIDVEMTEDGGVFTITTSDPNQKPRRIASGMGGIYMNDRILNMEGEFVSPRQIVQASTGIESTDVTPYKPKDEAERVRVIRLIAEIEFARETGKIDAVENLEQQLFDLVVGKDGGHTSKESDPDAVAEAAADPVVEQSVAQRPVEEMTETDLRAELKAVSAQLKQDRTNAELKERRKAIEQAIKALTRPKQEEPTTAAMEIVEQQAPAAPAPASQAQVTQAQSAPAQQTAPAEPGSAPKVGQAVVLGKGRQQGTITDVGDGFVKVKMGTRTEKMDMSTFNRRMAAAGDQAQPAPRRGEVGGMLAAGEVVTTSSGRQTTPFPKIDIDSNRKAVNTVKRVDQWLMQNALDEARARGDDFNARQFEANQDRPSQADKDSAEEYLFGEQPPVMRSTLKPLVRDEAESAERPAKRTAESQPNQTPVKDESPAAPEPKAEKPAASQTKPAGYGANNKLVTADRAAEVRAKLKAKLNGSQLNSGIDPEILAMGTELAVFHLEAGVRKFAEFARTMAADLDMPMEKLRPYLRSFYNGARDMMEDANLSIEGMDGPDEVRAALRQLDAGDTAPAAPAAKRETVSTPAGREFEVKHKVIEADELVTSNDATGAINPDYPKELQPRDRSRSASLDQINDIAGKLNPRLLGESASATDGAPIVSSDNVVESGNGRTLALRQAYARGMADRYREWLASQGYDVAGMKAPVLVRERVTPMTMDERIAYTTEANDRTTLELSSTERALSDARKMGPILHLYRGGDLQAAANRDFVRAFVGDVAAKADRGRILDGDGMLSQDGRRRIEAALLGSAYGDETLITDLFESADTDIKAIGGALLDVAGSWAKMREDAREGVISESVDTTPNLLEAVNLIRRARAEGRPILELVRQNDFFSGELDPVTLGFMSIFYRGESFTRARGRDKVAGELRYYTEQAQLSQPGTNMFGEPEVTGAEILRGTNDRLQRQEQQAGQQQDIFASPRTDGENAGAPGTDGQGPQPEAASQAPAQGGLNAPGSRERVERDRPDAGAAQPVVQAADGDAAGQDAEGAGQAGRGADGEQGAVQRDQRLPGDGAAARGERSDQPVHRADGQFQPESSTAGDPERSGSGRDSIQGQIVEQEREEAVADDAQAPGAGDLDQRLAAQRKAQNAPTKWGDKASIDAALPLLLPEQRDDVLKAEQRLAGHNGILYTNGTGTGKAQPLDAKILTPRGWVRMGDIQVGDEVISVDGTPTKVLGVYPQGEKGIYRVTFDDGSSTECCDEHLWLTQTLYERRKASKNPEWNCAKPKVRELSEIRATLDKRHFIPVVAPVQLQGDISQNLLPAYTLGVILGDGDLVGGSLRFTNPDEEVASRVAAELPASMGMVKQESDERCVSYRLTNSENGTEADGTFSKGAVRIELERLGLHGTDSFGKFIPREYLCAKIADRIALLQGLMDTDGTADERTNSAYFTTVSPSLKDDFVELVQSLGGVARVSEKVPTYTYRGERRTGQKAYTVNVVLPEGIDPFSLPRKADKLKPRTWGQVRRKIVSVDFVGEKAAQCIAVEHESHLYVTDNYIVTHNTATGLGVAKRFINDGKDNIVIVVPSDKIASDWVKFARMLGVELKQLADTNDNGKTGPIVTTYANFGQNESLAQRDWDLVIADESHYLSSNEGGDKTAALEQLRALTGHHAGFYRWVRQRHAKEWQAFSAAMQDRADANGNPDVPMERYIALEAAEAKAREKWNAIEQPAREKWNQRWTKQESLPKTVMLSATPFAYAKNVDYAEGYLFHYVEPADLLKSQGNVGGYNSGSPRDRFLMQHFGYRMRYNKLTAPESGVNSQLMEQQFNQLLKSTGALSGRRLEVAHDYDRKFVLVDDAVGTKIDEGLKYLREAEEGRYREVYEAVSKQFDYQRRMYLLESMKARAAVPIIREHLALGRKIVVFHDFNKGGGFNPFNDAIREIIDPDVKSMARSVLSKPMFKLDFTGLFSPIETLGEAFPDALFFNGTVSKGQRRANADLFNDDDSGRNLIVVQSDAGREGVSLHDTTGRHQRVEINLGMPVKPVAATQIEGRIYRTGQASDAIFRYLTTGTAWEAAAFASKIAERASTAENLALGEEARGLKEAFIDAYQNADAFPASAEDGKGGKDYDRKLSAAFTTSPFDRAKTFYWAQQKNSKRRDQREGQDYFATPEPVGFKMVEWANIQPNDKALEPSAGHGAIARFFPEQSDVTMVEPSYELSQRAALANGNARIVNDRFEQLHINNKFDAIVMNPPYGSGGKTSTEHLAKAAKHLRDGGRIVALIPRGGMADKRLDAFLESEEAADLYTVAKIAMPAVTFERAGTAVNTQVLVLEKHANAADAEGILQRNIDLSNAESVNELFDRLESLSLPDRLPTSTPEPKQEIVEHVTAKGKLLRGIIRTDLTKAEAQEIDKFTFAKKNAEGKSGWFIRAKHLDQGPRFSVASGHPFAGITREQFLGEPRITKDSNGSTLKPRALATVETAEVVPFAAGSGLTAKFSPDGAAVFDGDQVIASYNFGDTLVVDKKYRRQGIAEELVYQWRMRNPQAKPARERTKKSQALQEKVWERIRREMAASTPRYSVQDGEVPLSVNQVRAAITRGPFGVIVDKMVEKGLIVIHSNSSTLPKDMGRGKRGVQAVTEPGGKVHLVASNLTQQNANAVLLHEMFHSGVESLVGSKRWADLQGRLGSLYRQAERSSGKAREIFDRARARVADAKAQGAVARRMEVEEFGAYAIEEYESMPSAFRKWVDDLVGAIKAWMFSRYGLQIGQVTPAQLRALAKDALITIALHRRGELFGPIAERFSVSDEMRYSVRPSEAFNDLSQSQKDFLDKIGPTSLPQRLRDRFDQLTDNLGLRIRQAGVDRYAALLRNDQALLGEDTLEGSIASSAWVLARMSHAAGGAVSAMMDAGRIYLDPKEKVIDVREGTQGLAATLRSLGSPVEIDRFMGWIAANRANKLFKQGRENLFSHSEIEAGMKLSGGKLENGKSRSILYAKAWKELQQHRDDVLGIAEQAGLLKPAMTKPDAGLVIARKYEAPAAIIKQLTEAKNALDAARTPDMLNTAQQKVDMANDALLGWLKGAVNGMKIDMLNTPQDRLDAITQELDDLQRSQRELWSEEFYVPFYRVIDEDSIGGPRAGSGLSRQQAYKKLKGGKQHLNDLLDNTLLNFHHLIQASLKNQAAAQAMENAEALGIAEKTTEAKRDKKASTYVMVDGEKQWYDVSDPLTFKAVSALSSAGLNTPVMKVGRAFKRFFTNMTTITPQFVVANGLRDTLSAMATSPTSSVPFKTAFKGALTYWNDQNRARMMASGGAFSFGHVYGQNADEIKASMTVSMRKAKVLRDPKLIPGALLTAWRKYHAVTDFAENINRAGIWERNLEKGKLKAAFEARDLMDFSAHGDAIAIRILTDLVPFLNARIQGLDKLYRAGFKPGSKVAMGNGTKADRQAFARFLAVTGALTLASALLFLNNHDDEEYRKLEDWQRDTYWVIRIGDEMFFIPKPFEVGAIATMGERLAEQFIDPAVGGEKFAQRLGHMLTDTFSFDPTPQLVKPAVEVFWKNKDSFTGRPIEDQSMERLSPSLRSRPDTSRLADAASRGMEAAAGLVGGQDLALSPVQIDHLIRGYTGSVGATAVATADTLWRRAMGEELPARRWHEYQPIKRFYRDLTQEPTYTRYGTDFYEALKKADRAYSSLMHLRKYDEARAKKYESEHDRELKLRDMLKLPRREITQINAEMKKVQMDKTKSGESKRLELDRLRSQRNMIMQQVGEDLEREAIRRRAAAD